MPTRWRTFLAALLAAVAAGCAGPAREGETYTFDVEFGFTRYDVQDPVPENVVSGGPNVFRGTWYPLGVEDDKYPYAVQPYVQRAPYVSFGAGFGDYEMAPGGVLKADTSIYEIGGGYVHKETGLGGCLAASFERIDMEAGPELDLNDWDVRVLIQTETSFQGYIGYRGTSKAYNFEESFFNGGEKVDAWWLEFGTRQVFAFPHNQSLEYAVAYEYGRYDLQDLYGVEPRFNRTNTLLKYYPAKWFGIGISLALTFFDEDLGIISNRHRFEVGLDLDLTIKERFDLGIDVKGFSNNQQILGQPKSYSEVQFSMGYRF